MGRFTSKFFQKLPVRDPQFYLTKVCEGQLIAGLPQSKACRRKRACETEDKALCDPLPLGAQANPTIVTCFEAVTLCRLRVPGGRVHFEDWFSYKERVKYINRFTVVFCGFS